MTAVRIDPNKGLMSRVSLFDAVRERVVRSYSEDIR